MADLYEQLREKLDQLSVGFPKTESGVEIKLLKKLLDKEHAELFLEMTPFVQKPSSWAKKQEGIQRRLRSFLKKWLKKA